MTSEWASRSSGTPTAAGTANFTVLAVDSLGVSGDRAYSLTVTGTLTIGSGVLGLNDFVFSNVGGLETGTYKLITTSGGIPAPVVMIRAAAAGP